MAQRLPNLHWLKIFEAAGRLGSFKAAAEELHLTASAVSHQIKSLEAFFDTPLFFRRHRKIQLTPAGSALLSVVQDIFSRLKEGLHRVSTSFGKPVLRITTTAALATNIIIPRLGEFQVAYPNIDLRIETGLEVADLRNTDLDLALRLGAGDWPGLASEKLFPLHITPVCAPDFARRHGIEQLEQLQTLPLIGLSTPGSFWLEWGEKAGIDLSENHPALSFSTYEATIHAAAQGYGFALGGLPIETPSLIMGRLVAPFSQRLLWQNAIYAVSRSEDEQRVELRAFLTWLREVISRLPEA